MTLNEINTLFVEIPEYTAICIPLRIINLFNKTMKTNPLFTIFLTILHMSSYLTLFNKPILQAVYDRT
jgi:hypothetical protein